MRWENLNLIYSHLLLLHSIYIRYYPKYTLASEVFYNENSVMLKSLNSSSLIGKSYSLQMKMKARMINYSLIFTYFFGFSIIYSLIIHIEGSDSPYAMTDLIGK